MLADADACGARGEHFTAAQLAFAACAGKGNACAGEAERAWASLKQLARKRASRGPLK